MTLLKRHSCFIFLIKMDEWNKTETVFVSKGILKINFVFIKGIFLMLKWVGFPQRPALVLSVEILFHLRNLFSGSVSCHKISWDFTYWKAPYYFHHSSIEASLLVLLLLNIQNINGTITLWDFYMFWILVLSYCCAKCASFSSR